ncbi:MAG TPA: phosphoribosyl-AMP cyclohydrolase [Candidatus Limnocylindrales bacterium]|nr:phosphoribosyl-AMP cyclohydrolase [Candidatus Limnocylindrales bacterium]
MKNFIDFKKNKGLVPAIIQDYKTGVAYMLGYMNQEALRKTTETNLVYFWSRNTKKLWLKGEESGNKLKVIELFADCDNDTILIKVELIGSNVCHTGSMSCFYTKLGEKI